MAWTNRTKHVTTTTRKRILNRDKHEKKISHAARQAGIREALKASRSRDVYIIHSNLNTDTLRPYRRYNPRIVIIDPGKEITLERCTKERPFYRRKQVEDWYANRHKWPKGAEVITDFTPDEASEVMPIKEGEATLHVVTGPPAAGKTTYVAEHAKPGDVRIDLDHLASTLAGVDVDNHEHEAHILTVAKAARQAAIDAAMKQDCTVWLIHTKPTPKQLDEYQALGAVINEIDPGKDVVMKRCKTERPKGSLFAAAKWYDNKPKGKKSTHERGYGHQHQKQRRKLMAQLKDGTPCPECGKPMFKTATKNFDGAALEADHGPGSALKYAENKQTTKATRLLHRTCNRSGGAWDRPRPTHTGAKLDKPKAGGFVWA